MADKQTTDSWIADGKADAEPVTTETPAVEVVEEVVETAVVETETVETTEEVTTETVAETVEEVVQKFIDAKHGDEAFQLPEGLLVPQTRAGETKMVPIEDVLSQGMMGDDYRIKTTELAEGRRSLERSTEDMTAREARLETRVAQLDAQAQEMKAALTDPKSAAAYQEHLAQYASNPMYAKNVDAALRQQETEAELSVLQSREDARIVTEASQRAFGWIDSLKGEYETVDPERVRLQYARELSAGTLSLDINAVRSIFEAEKEHVNRTLSPLQDQLSEITAQLKALQDGAAATEHNETTAHAVTRAKTIPVATGAGAPTNVEVPKGKFTPRELQGRISDWTKAGRA